jgi:hypothetical protein
MADDRLRRRRRLEDIPHKQAGDVRVVDVPARQGVIAHKDYLVPTACGQEIPTTLVTRSDDRVRCTGCKAAMAAGVSAEFPSIQAFYDAGPVRRGSGATGEGVGWQGAGRAWAQRRMSYIRATGEICPVRQRGFPIGPIRALGIVPPDPVEEPYRGGHRRTLEGILAGWEDPHIFGHDLAWIERRLAAAQEG